MGTNVNTNQSLLYGGFVVLRAPVPGCYDKEHCVLKGDLYELRKNDKSTANRNDWTAAR